MNQPTLHGVPIDDEWMWAVLILDWSGSRWRIMPWTVSQTRRGAIALFDRDQYGEPYAKLRRKGRARALHVRITAHTFGEI